MDEDDPADAPPAAKRSALVRILILVVAAGGWVAFGLQNHSSHEQLKELRAANESVAVRAPASVQTYTVTPARGGPPANPSLTLGWPNPPRLLELRIDAAELNFNAFQVTIEKVGAARILQVRRVGKDSNKQLQLTLNSSAFGPGDYLLKLEGYTWRGDLLDAGWVKLALQ